MTFQLKILLSFLILFFSETLAGKLTQQVNPFIGTDAHGHTFPGATVRFGMVQLSPDTRVEGWDACAGYHYSDSTILGFSHTHLSGTGVADYGDILITPEITDTLLPLKFNHQNEHASPGSYRVSLDDGKIEAQLTATTRVGFHRYTFHSNREYIFIDLHHGLGPDSVLESNIQIVNDHEVTGLRRSTGWAKDQYVYFDAQFSKPIVSSGIFINDTLHAENLSASGRNLKAYAQFSASQSKRLLVKVGISSVSIENARKNLQSEIPGWNFDDVKKHAENLWEKELSKIVVQGGTKDQRITFYTALYHAMIAPNVFSDVDGSYRGMDGKIHTADGFTMYTVFSLWDTFRAEHPLLTIIDQKRTLDFIKSFLAKYDQSGILPVWELASNETWCMIGYHSVPVIVDAYAKGIKNFDAEKALTAMEHSADLDHYGLQYYRTSGFVPGEKESESVSKTLEYSYDDWCIARMCDMLGRRHYEEFSNRAQYYKNIFDPSTGFMRPKVNGDWLTPFDPTAVTNYYTEANAWQYTFFVPQDIDGMIDLYGGKVRFIRKLDSLFTSNPILTGRNQADISGMIGEYAQGNEPSHHVAYLYDYAGAPWKTQEIVRHIMDTLYTSKPDGLCGNDDCGQMSAWYVMSAIGLYQVTPGDPVYAIGSPLFDKITIHEETGKQFVISAEHNSGGQKYIQSAQLNKDEFSSPFIEHNEIMNGGTLSFVMGNQPNKQWAANPVSHPSKVTPIVTVPIIQSAGRSFRDSMQIVLACNTPDAKIHFSVNGNFPEVVLAKSVQFTLRYSSTITAFAEHPGMKKSGVVSAEFIKTMPIGSITLHTSYSPQYTGGGDSALVDGIRGTEDFRLGAWQGYEGNNLDAVIDLGSSKTITSVALGCLQDINSWIFFPTQVKFSFSENQTTWTDSIVIKNDVSQKSETAERKDFGKEVKNIQARYVRVEGNNVGICPPWHKGAGNKAWLFVDEVNITTK